MKSPPPTPPSSPPTTCSPPATTRWPTASWPTSWSCIDPTQNPDGRDRFVNHYEQNRGLEPDASPAAAERNEAVARRPLQPLPVRHEPRLDRPHPARNPRPRQVPARVVPPGLGRPPRNGHRLHLLLRARAPTPYNPHLTKEQRERPRDLFGQNNAKWFDQLRLRVTSRARSSTTSIPATAPVGPAYHGGMGMTYEQASVRGLVVRKSDESFYAFRESVRKHFVASLATAETAPINRAEAASTVSTAIRVTAIEEGQKEAVKEYILPRARRRLGRRQARRPPGGTRRRSEARLGGLQDRRRTRLSRRHLRRAAPPSRASASSAPCSRSTIPWIRSSSRNRSVAANGNSPTRSTTSPRWSLPLLYNVECVAAGENSGGSFASAEVHYGPRRKSFGQSRSRLPRSMGYSGGRTLHRRGPSRRCQNAQLQQAVHARQGQVPVRHAHHHGQAEPCDHPRDSGPDSRGDRRRGRPRPIRAGSRTASISAATTRFLSANPAS